MEFTATYSPDDNKLRLYASGRLDDETYRRVHAGGFRHAPRQDCFVAPAWSPHREDLLLELCGEIGDEDTTLVDRAEARAERFTELGGRRATEARSTQEAVDRVASAIPPGQPILVGHHSEGRARRDVERIDAGMRRVINLWETSSYWERRARAALQHARYKEKPAVRARRIKRLESERRSCERNLTRAEREVSAWQHPGLTADHAMLLAGTNHVSYEFPLDRYPRQPPANQYEGPMGLWGALDGNVITVEQAKELAVTSSKRVIEVNKRWIQHYDHRLAYERAMLAESGGIAADRTPPEKGGACQCWASPRGGWSTIQKVNRVSVSVHDNFGNGGPNFTRTIPFDKLSALMSAAEVAAARAEGRVVDSSDGKGFFLRPAEPSTPPEES
jgi:hypothetical protein